MLVELAIRNFAIIEAVQISFGPGLNVLTGETGAGKSILIDALGAVLGDRVSTDMVRTGAASAAIDATFDLNSGLPIGMRSRRCSRSSRSKTRTGCSSLAARSRRAGAAAPG